MVSPKYLPYRTIILRTGSKITVNSLFILTFIYHPEFEGTNYVETFCSVPVNCGPSYMT